MFYNIETEVFELVQIGEEGRLQESWCCCAKDVLLSSVSEETLYLTDDAVGPVGHGERVGHV